MNNANSRISGVIPSFEGGIPSDEMIECKHKNNPKCEEALLWKRKR